MFLRSTTVIRTSTRFFRDRTKELPVHQCRQQYRFLPKYNVQADVHRLYRTFHLMKELRRYTDGKHSDMSDGIQQLNPFRQ